MLYIPYQEDVIRPGNGPQDAFLHGVDILIFIHEHMLKAATVFGGDGRLLQKRQSHMLHIRIIHQAALLLALCVAAVEGQHQIAQGLHLRFDGRKPCRLLA